jgi:hypothetical protein
MPSAKSPHSRAINPKRLTKVSTQGLGTVGLELGTHHPVIEPVSAYAGNGISDRRDRG